ncbi:MAG TPA: hypothetical protein VJU61_20345 [Polyangiaceae bacterium]|nr:hypothetical protein [Polyangiaceae bacterium]
MKFKYLPALAWLGLLSLRAASSPAQTTEERAGARAAADQGYDAFKAGRWATAIDLFSRAESLVHSPVHVLFLARSQAKLGLLLEAKEAYLQVLREPAVAAPAAGVKQARADAERELGELEPQIPLVSIQIEGAEPSEVIEVTQDGLPLSRALIGVARPLNPGQHIWRAASDSRPPVTVQRGIEPGTESQVNLRLAPQREVELVAVAPRPVSEPHDVPPPAASGGPSGWVYAGLGVTAVGVGVGIGFLLRKNHLEDQILETCTPDCSATPDNLERKEDADTAGLISAVGFVGAGVGLTSALVLWLLEPSGKASGSAAATVDWQPWVGARSAGVSGRF